MSGDLLVLLLALVVEDQNFLAAALVEDFAGHHRSRLWTRNLPLAGRHCQHVRELDLAVCPPSLGFQANHVSGRHSVLLSTSADDRVHTPASVVSFGCTPPRRKEPSLNLVRLLFFPRRPLPTIADSPRTGPQVQ